MVGGTIFRLGGGRWGYILAGWGWVRLYFRWVGIGGDGEGGGGGTQFSVNHIKLILVGVDIYGAWF